MSGANITVGDRPLDGFSLDTTELPSGFDNAILSCKWSINGLV
jgi:hypothetical protein